MDESKFYLLRKYYEAGETGIKWRVMSTEIIVSHEYLNVPKDPLSDAHTFLINYKYIERKLDSRAHEINYITQKGIDAYLYEKCKNDLKESELQREKKFKEQLSTVNQSVIDTNVNAIVATNAQIKFQNRYLLFTGLTTFFILITVYQQCRDKSVQELQGIQIELQRIDTTLKNIQPFLPAKDSSMMR